MIITTAEHHLISVTWEGSTYLIFPTFDHVSGYLSHLPSPIIQSFPEIFTSHFQFAQFYNFLRSLRRKMEKIGPQWGKLEEWAIRINFWHFTLQFITFSKNSHQVISINQFLFTIMLVSLDVSLSSLTLLPQFPIISAMEWSPYLIFLPFDHVLCRLHPCQPSIHPPFYPWWLPIISAIVSSRTDKMHPLQPEAARGGSTTAHCPTSHWPGPAW